MTVLVVLLGTGLAGFTLFDVSGYDMIGVGWTLDGVNFLGGSLRMLFPFSLGMLLSRKFKPFQMKGAFWICSIVLLILFCVPYIKVDTAPISLNGLQSRQLLYHPHFPLVLVWLGASRQNYGLESVRRKYVNSCGVDISYPLYAVHYPIMYLFYAANRQRTLYLRRNLAYGNKLILRRQYRHTSA
ncbi:MAG: hypothetical protein ACLR6J_19215 [Parabacteroides merdae]